MADETDPAQDALLLAFLKDRDVACPLCQYNLRDLTITTCPECGETIELAVRARDVVVQAWTTLVVALSLPAGVGVYVVLIGIRRGWPSLHDPDAPVFYTFIGMIPLAVTAVAMRRKFLRLSRSAQFCITALAVCGAVVLFSILGKGA